MLDLFAEEPAWREPLADGAAILWRFAIRDASALLAAIETLSAQAPFRHMVTPGGYSIAVAMTNCGASGWVSSRSGYCYTACDPLTGAPWPKMPPLFLTLAVAAARAAGYENFHPDACLINRYSPGAKLSLHQDKDEYHFDAPIVSVSLGLPAIFQFGGLRRADPLSRHYLDHGDVAVWGGSSRLFYHGIAPLKNGHHPEAGAWRYNLTFRRAAKEE